MHLRVALLREIYTYLIIGFMLALLSLEPWKIVGRSGKCEHYSKLRKGTCTLGHLWDPISQRKDKRVMTPVGEGAPGFNRSYPVIYDSL